MLRLLFSAERQTNDRASRAHSGAVNGDALVSVDSKNRGLNMHVHKDEGKGRRGKGRKRGTRTDNHARRERGQEGKGP